MIDFQSWKWYDFENVNFEISGVYKLIIMVCDSKIKTLRCIFDLVQCTDVGFTSSHCSELTGQKTGKFHLCAVDKVVLLFGCPNWTDSSAQLLSTATVQFHTDIHQHDAVFLETKQQQFVYFSEKATDFP